MAHHIYIKDAVKLTGKSRRTIYRDMDRGSLSYHLDARDRRYFDAAELSRVYGPLQGVKSEAPPAPAHADTPAPAQTDTPRHAEPPYQEPPHAPIEPGRGLTVHGQTSSIDPMQIALQALQAMEKLTDENRQYREMVAQLVEENRQDREYMNACMQTLLGKVGEDKLPQPTRQALQRQGGGDDPHGLRKLLRQIANPKKGDVH